MSALLGAVAERVDVKYVRTEEATLHEIYLRTVGAEAEPAEAVEVA
jgi:hypothetical protein